MFSIVYIHHEGNKDHYLDQNISSKHHLAIQNGRTAKGKIANDLTSPGITWHHLALKKSVCHSQI